MERVLIKAAAETLWMVRDDEPPEAFSHNDDSLIVFKRLVEMQAEQCGAIDILCENGLFRPAHSILRSLLETSATLVWVGHDVERYGSLFFERKQPNIKEILKRIGWEKEYEITYEFLSNLVHTDSESMHMYRFLEVEQDGLFPEILPDGENYIVTDSDGNQVMIGMPAMSSDEAASLYEPYLETKTFDLTLCCLVSLYGKSARSYDWWPVDKVGIFEARARYNQDIARNLLWCKVRGL